MLIYNFDDPHKIFFTAVVKNIEIFSTLYYYYRATLVQKLLKYGVLCNFNYILWFTKWFISFAVSHIFILLFCTNRRNVFINIFKSNLIKLVCRILFYLHTTSQFPWLKSGLYLNSDYRKRVSNRSFCAELKKNIFYIVNIIVSSKE